MSYDVDLMIDTGGPEMVSVYSRNHTSNTSGMWRAAGCDIAEFHDKPASEFAAALAPAIEKLKATPEEFRQYEPANRWGTLDSTIEFLSDLLDACEKHPKTTVSVWR